ncbi:SDR family NAD(P)-dependent oxidoreductase [Streptomyces oceani]|uniref:SDR family NAD(P)-dependent oxidoreductase n=1 Tax=Streptomyces oceani TaxID=1075402 RepID=UPI000871CE5B|nr:SDR family NAD(P)-dependent oxidoreductase [Streptomyces oceani]
MPTTSAIPFRVVGEDVETFARASGDHSPLHTDEVYARHTSFGQPVVHGALGVLRALATLPEPAEGQEAASLEARFHAPIFTGQHYTATTEPGEGRARVRITDGARPVLDLEVGYAAPTTGQLPPASGTPRRVAAVRALDDLTPGELTTAAFAPDEVAYDQLLERSGAARAGVTVPLAALLGWASYLVGMEAPGRPALASRYAVSLRSGAATSVPGAHAEVTTVDARFGRLELTGRVSGPGLTGTVDAEALVRDEPPAPRAQGVLENLGRSDTALSGRVALVVGASRGLGAALTQALVLRGATVYGGYHRSRAEAEAVRSGLGEASGRLRLLQGDWSDPAWCAEARERVIDEQGRLDVLLLSACPPVNTLGLDAAAGERADAYVADSLALTRGPLSAFARDVADNHGWVLALSSQWVIEPPAGRSHYVTAKYAVEGLLHGAAVEYPTARFLIVRPPRLATSLSGGIAGQRGGTPVEPVAAAVVGRVLEEAEPGRAHLLDTFEASADARTEALADVGDDAPADAGADARAANDETPPSSARSVPTSRPGPPDTEPDHDVGPALVIAGTFTSDPLAPVLEYWGRRLGLRFEFASYGQVFRELLDPRSAFRRNDGGCNAVLLRPEDWVAAEGNLARTVDDFVAAAGSYAAARGAPLLVHICPPEPSSAVGGRARALDEARETLNRELAELSGVHLTGGDRWGAGYETDDYHDPARLAHAHIPYTDPAYTALGTALTRSAHGLLSAPFKVLVLDCDNTLWRGVCGEDGPDGVILDDAHLELQRWALRLRERGVLICLASKNDEDGVAEVFRRRTTMPLRWEHLAAWRINWEPKARGLAALAAELGLGLDSFVFLDDNPVEVASVRSACPQVLALTFPADQPGQVPGLLERIWAFDSPEVTAEDRRRADTYTAHRQREGLRRTTLSFADFIADLDLTIDVRRATDSDLARVAQLTQRTNQFNFSTIRRTEAEIRGVLTDYGADARCWVADVRDRFGDYGLVGAALTRQDRDSDTVVLDTFLMSCRVLGRGVEHQLLARLGTLARADGARFLEAEFRPTPKNEPAHAFLESVAAEHARRRDDGSVCYRMPVEHTAAITFRPEEAGAPEEAAGGERELASAPFDPVRLATLTELAERVPDLAALNQRVHGTDSEPSPEGAGRRPAAGGSSDTTDLDAVRTAVREVFARTLAHPRVPVTTDATFEALHLSSLDTVNLTVALEKRLGRELPTTLLFEHRGIDDLARSLADSPRETRATQAPPSAVAVPSGDTTEVVDEAVAVVGLAGRYPGADTVDELWDLLTEGRDAVRELSSERWDHSRYLSPASGPRTTYSAWAALLADVDRFDAQFFGIAPREAEMMDPQQRLFLEVAHEAVQDAGHTRASLGADVGVYVGVMANDYAALSRSAAVTGHAPFPYAENYQIANRVSYHLDLTGPSLAVDTACSSSAVALHQACEAIRRGEVAAGIAGGVNLILHPARHIQYAQMGMLSRDGVCRPFGAGADGFVMGEGVGAVLLKPLSRALADGDHIHGVIRGSWTNSGGHTSGFTVPNPRAQAELISRALAAARVDPRTVGYVEAHGSGTELGDPIEIRGLTTAFGTDPDESGGCAVGSVKSAIGHLESAAGIAGLTKVLLQLRHRRLVPTLHADTLNPHIDFDRTPFRVQRELAEWRPGDSRVPLRAGVSSFGAGGVNAHLVVEESPVAEREARSPADREVVESPELVVLSAADPERMRAYARALYAHLTTGPGRAARLADVAHTLRVGREALTHRAAFVARDRGQLTEYLSELAEQDETPGVVHGRADGGDSLADVLPDGDETAAFLSGLVASGELSRVGRVWARGGAVRWDVLFDGAGRSRVPLPAHPFRRTRHWLEGAPLGDGQPEERSTPAAAPAALPDRAATDRGEERPWFLRTGWRKAPPAEPLSDPGNPVVVALPGGGWQPWDPRVVAARDESDVLRTVEDAQRGNRVVVFDGRRLDPGALDEDPLRLPLQLARARATGAATVTYVALGLPDAEDPAGASVAAFTRSVEREMTGFRGIRIEMDGTDEVAGTEARPAVPGLSELLTEASGTATEVRLAAGGRWVRALEPFDGTPTSVSPWRERGVYLVTGGAGGIGGLLAERLARTHRASLILLGRRPADEETGRLVDRVERLGGRALYVSADVCDRRALTAAIAEGVERFGPLHGVVHAAGTVEDASLRDKTDASIARVVAPKTVGARLLDEITADSELDFFCLMSSVNGTLGNAGQSDYAAANRYLDAFALWRDARAARGERHGLSVSVAWPHWHEGGMSAPPESLALAETTTGLRPMGTEAGLGALDQVLVGEPGRTVVGVGDRDRFVAAFAGTPPEDPSDTQDTPDSAAGPPPSVNVAESLHDMLRGMASRLLKTPGEEIDADAELGSYGFTSVLLAHFCSRINDSFGTSLTPVMFFEHPTLNRLTTALQRNETVRRALTSAVAEETEPQPEPQPEPEPEVKAEVSSVPTGPVAARRPVAADGNRGTPPVPEGRGPDQRGGPPTGAEPIAVVGMAGRFPGAPDLETYWANLVAGDDAVREVDPERWDWRSTVAGESCRYGGFIDDVDAFDAEFFGISPREARSMDPQQRLFLESSWSALEHAGYDPRSLAGGRTGVFAGVTLHDWVDVLREHGERPAAHTVTGNVHSIVPNRVSHLLDLRGPSEALDTACSSSLAALHRAVGALRSGECDSAIAGGVNVLLSTGTYESLARAGMLSPTGHCHAFGDAADGYVRSEGVGALLLKPLSRARRDGDTVHGMILGSAVNHGGRGHSLTAPTPSAQADVVVEAIRAAGVPAGSVTFVETHGTGTELGDPIEVSGLQLAFDRLGAGDHTPGGCALGAVKSNIGHLESAAGIASLVKVLLTMRYRTLPPNLHCDSANRHLNLTGSPFRLLRTAEPWKPATGADGTVPPLRAGVSSFGFGGSNAHVVLEEPPLMSVSAFEDSARQAVTLSAHDPERLREYARLLRDRLSRAGDDVPALADLAYTTQVGRPSLGCRVALVAESAEELRDRLAEFLAVGGGPDVYTGDVPTSGSGQPPPTAPDPATAGPEELARAWAAGAGVDWNAVHDGQARRRVPLPSHPFDHSRRHGPLSGSPPRAESAPANPSVATGSAGTGHTTADTGSGRHPVLLERRWDPLPDSPRYSGRRVTCLLVLRGRESLGLVGALDSGTDWIVLRERSDLPRLLPPEYEYELDLDDHEEGEAVAAAILARHPRVDIVVDLVDLDGPADSADSASAAGETGLGHEAGRVALLQALVRHTTDSELRLVHTTRGLAPLRNPRPGLTGARMAAVVRGLGSEYGSVRATTLDLEWDTDSDTALAHAVRETETAGEEPEVCLRGRVRYAPRLADLPPDDAPHSSRDSFGGFTIDPEGVYVITGGTGGLGAAVARELFARGARRFALLGRRPVAPVGEWAADATAPGLPNGMPDLVALRDQGAHLRVHSGPLTDRAALRAFLDDTRSGLGAIAGVLHCAGSADQRNPVFVRKTWKDIATTWEPKGEGLATLDELLAEDAPDFVVLYSSLSAVLPDLSVGLVDYGSANAYLDAFAAHASRRGSRTRYLSVAWGSWSEIGMGEVRGSRYTEQGFASLSPAEGVGLLDAALRRDVGPTVVALARAGAPETGEDDGDEPVEPLLTRVTEALRELIAEEVMVPRERVEPDTDLAALGVDSILLAGVMAKLETLTGEPVPPSAVMEHPTAGRLAAHLLQEYARGVTAWAADRSSSAQAEWKSPEARTSTPAVPEKPPVPARTRPAAEEPTAHGPLAVIGMSSRFPGAPTTEDYWDLLRTGRSAVTEAPASRWDVGQLYAPALAPGRSISKWGGFLDGIEQYDPGFFGVPEEEAAHVDPVIRLVMECAEQTFRDAGYERSELAGRRVGVFAGAGTTGYGTRITEPRRGTVTGLNPNFIGAHLAHVYDFGGPNMVVDTACSSSLTALYLARQALLLGECDLALVAGADVLLDERPYLKLSAAQALSPSGQCRVFDTGADGIVPGEGVGGVLLKRLDSAVADGDRVHAVLESVAMNNDGRTMGLTTPNPDAQERVVLDALRAANVDPRTVSCVEAHGTGTMIGDPMELRALTRAFRRSTEGTAFCAVGSVKSNIGHLLMASGMAGLHKLVLALRHRRLPPTLHCETPNPRFSFDTSPFYPNTELRDWAPSGGLRRAGLSSFGFGGTNCHAILREPLDEERGNVTRVALPPADFHRARHWIEPAAPSPASARATEPPVPVTEPPAPVTGPRGGRRYLELLADDPVSRPAPAVASHPADGPTSPHRPYLQLEELS